MFKVTKVEPYEIETIQEATERIINQLEEDGHPLVDLFVVNGDVNIVYEFYPEAPANPWEFPNIAPDGGWIEEDEEGFV